MRSIQSKILLVVIAGLLVITAIVSAIAVNMTHGIMHKDADRILENATQKEAAYINDMLGDIMLAGGIVKHYATTEIGSADDLRDTAFLNDYLGKTKKMFAEIAVNAGGVQGFYMRIAPEYSNGSTGFYQTVNETGKLLEMPLSDLGDYAVGDHKNAAWYYEAVEAGEGVWIDPYYYKGTGAQLITYAQPLYAGSDLFGVIGFDIDFSYLIKKIDEINVYEHGYTSLLAKDGETRYNTTPIVESHNPTARAQAKLKNGMYLAMTADYKDIQKDIHPMLSRITLAFLMVLLASIVYTVLVTRKITGPLKRLTAAAETLAVGVVDADLTQVPIESKDEIGTLSKALANTYSKIQEYTTYINALAYRDSLTGVKNSTAYIEAIATLNKEILTGKPQFGVVVADINNLKVTNDKYGHDIGNDLIVHTSKILCAVFKNSAVYRIGGDEFAVILQGNDYANYRALLKQTDEACSHDFITVCENNIPVSLARGVAVYDPDVDHVYEDVFAKADHAMYLNKKESKAVTV